MKIVINKCYGGFSINKEFRERFGVKWDWDVSRTDPKLIELLETYGSQAVSGNYASLSIVEVPDDATDWRLNEYDGWESVTYVQDGKMYDL